MLYCNVSDEKLVAPSIFRVAEAAQQLYAIATSRADRRTSDFKDRLASIVREVAAAEHAPYESDVELPIPGGYIADHVIGKNDPLIIVAATGVTRLLEAEVIYMQYQINKKKGKVFAIVESQDSVGKKQFERANYVTWKTLVFSSEDLRCLLGHAYH